MTYYIRGKKFNGDIIILPHDCDCLIHDGPHEIYVDVFDARNNYENFIKTNKNVLDCQAFLNNEIYRLTTKKTIFVKYNIIKIILPFSIFDCRWNWFSYRQYIPEHLYNVNERNYEEWSYNYINR